MCVLHGDAVEDGEGVFEGGGTDEGESEGLEVVKSLKISAIVFAHLEDGSAFSFKFRGGEEVTAADLHALGNGNLPFWFAAEGPLALFENPGVTYGTAADKDAVDTILAAPIIVQSALPLYIWVLVRPWMLRAAIPVSCNASQKSVIIMES